MPDPKPAKEPLSKTPSWIMLGFVIGCIVALTVKKDFDGPDKSGVPAVGALASMKPTARPAEIAVPVKTAPATLSLSDMEAIFERWGRKAVWRHELTEVAYWNPATNQYSEYVEVVRSGEDLYFRSIPRLTRPLWDDESEPSSPIRFTELEETRAARRAPFIITPH